MTATDDTRGRVLQAARQCFARHGVHRTTMADVARSAGISRQTLYNTIAGRDELVEAVTSPTTTSSTGSARSTSRSSCGPISTPEPSGMPWAPSSFRR